MNSKNEFPNSKEYFLKEFVFFDGEYDITFNIVDINFEKKTITLAVTHTGRISRQEFDLLQKSNGDYYFEYGITFNKIELDDFETIEEN